jgi:hypothetical protein
MRASVVPLGEAVAATPPSCRRCRRVTLAAGECGVKDQVSRTQPPYRPGNARRLPSSVGR